ncbi:hypothetical protein GCM10023322_63600 [Rugosimonospora acidiphila]|uniref:Anti-sigma factor antagonist n=1 Tax=Rugosimonospora acidiphila TaxID=556531 RepID=A0ABP9SGG2_9ACTN
MPRLEISRQDLDHGLVRLRLTGNADLSDVDRLEDAQRVALEAPETRRLVVDLENLEFLDSSGIAVMVAGYRSARSRGQRYQVINPRGLVRRVLDLTGVLTTLTPLTA